MFSQLFLFPRPVRAPLKIHLISRGSSRCVVGIQVPPAGRLKPPTKANIKSINREAKKLKCGTKYGSNKNGRNLIKNVGKLIIQYTRVLYGHLSVRRRSSSYFLHTFLTTKNSCLSTRWLPSVSNMLKAIWNAEWGSKMWWRQKQWHKDRSGTYV